MLTEIKKIKKEISCSPDSIVLVESIVDYVSSDLGLNDETTARLYVSLTEAAKNSIMFGVSDISNNFCIEVDYESTRISVLVKDNGPGFDFMSVPDPTLPENIEKTSGRGLFLIKHLTDELSFANNGATIKMVFNLD